MIAGQFELSFADLIALPVAVPRDPWRSFGNAVLFSTLNLAGAWAAVSAWADMRSGYALTSARTRSSLGLALACAMAAAFVVQFPRLLLALIYAIFRIFYLGKQVSFQLTDAGMNYGNQFRSRSAPWNSVTFAVASNQALVLGTGRVSQIVLPRRAFANSGDFEAARKLAHDKVAQNMAAKPAGSA